MKYPLVVSDYYVNDLSPYFEIPMQYYVKLLKLLLQTRQTIPLKFSMWKFHKVKVGRICLRVQFLEMSPIYFNGTYSCVNVYRNGTQLMFFQTFSELKL